MSETNNNSDADEPHWHLFKQVNCEPNDWEFRHLKEGIACIENTNHRFTIQTTLVEREWTADRYFTVYYEPASVDPFDEDECANKRVPIHQGTSDSIARNNIGHARDSIDEDDASYVVVVEENGEETVCDVPSAHIADKVADVYTRIRLDTDRDVRAIDYTKSEWEDRVELKQN